MTDKKYKIRKDLSIEFEGHTLYRIEALRNISYDVEKGDIGGFIEKTHNLSQIDKCWIYNDAKVFGEASVYNDAAILNNAIVKDNAKAFDHTIVRNNVIICKDVKISGSMHISGNLLDYGIAILYPVYKQNKIVHLIKSCNYR